MLLLLIIFILLIIIFPFLTQLTIIIANNSFESDDYRELTVNTILQAYIYGLFIWLMLILIEITR